ncbi:Putative aliphatic sulfonates transport permease protein SsuC [Sporomusa silvacetica DSM 10669]|uniref:Aliphatic sulfonates transport permease protein SsuC n=1 Tax=Sporomusa silvacetica DSM 10669 TaxID=1123289 RepID=A0ABZ3IH55_9FIRM|nr:ABC transporter permease [Sporomusa silvacetica]OZC14833.1 putative aliphatic sulfonates transport permease protein SsuC [Sporomusa silvacetica DSM 10669]
MKRLVSCINGSLERSMGIVLLLLLWEIAPRVGLVDITYLSPPSQVLVALSGLLTSGELGVHVLSSLKRALAGLFLAVIVGAGFGLFIGSIKRIERVLDSVFQTFRQMSAFALFPVFILFFGIGEVSKTVIIFWASLWPVLLNTISGVKNVDKLLVDSAKSMGASQYFIFTKVILPAAAPGIFTGIRLGGSYCVMSLVAAEMIGAHSGLGYLVLYSQETFKISDMYGAIVGLTLVGLGLNYALTYIEKVLSGWKEETSVNG